MRLHMSGLCWIVGSCVVMTHILTNPSNSFPAAGVQLNDRFENKYRKKIVSVFTAEPEKML